MSGKRGERMARWMLDRLDLGQVKFELVPTDDSRRGIRFLNSERFSKAQSELAAELVLFAMGYPRNFGTLCRLMREREARP